MHSRFRTLMLPSALFATSLALAQEAPETSADDVARALANPNAVLGTLNFPIDYIEYQGNTPGASDQSVTKLSFQPSFPYPLNESTNLFVRPLIPVFFDQPVPVVADQPVTQGPPNFTSTGTEIGDIGFDVGIGKSFASGMVMVGGVVGTLNTGTDDAVSINQNLLGPEFLIAKISSWGAYGVLLTHQWDIGGTDAYDTSITGGQYFFTYNLGNAWQISMQPTFSYNHEAGSGDKLTFPVGIGVAKTIVFGNTPWKFGLQYWNYIESPNTFGPDTQIRFSFAPVIPLPW